MYLGPLLLPDHRGCHCHGRDAAGPGKHQGQLVDLWYCVSRLMVHPQTVGSSDSRFQRLEHGGVCLHHRSVASSSAVFSV